MRLTKINYSQFDGTSSEWKINNLTLSNINLIVGINAVGKTRTINVIYGLARMLSEEKKIIWTDGNYSVEFIDGKKKVECVISYHDRLIQFEQLKINGEILLERNKTGEGSIYFQELNDRIKFQTPTDEIASFVRRDSIQHPFLESLNKWATNCVLYKFGSSMGQTSLLLAKDLSSITKVNVKDSENIGPIFIAGTNSQFSDEFIQKIINDMKAVDYEIDSIDINRLTGFKIRNSIIPEEFITESSFGLSVKENDLNIDTPQHEMSQGMFRCLSLIIQFNYFLLNNKSGTILIDDIGEGLDFNRASALISLLIDKAESSDIQLIMTTNDRFVMNNVPIKYWTILHRDGGNIDCYNIRNSEDVFSRFASTGLNNFDLLSSNYYLIDNNPLDNDD